MSQSPEVESPRNERSKISWLKRLIIAAGVVVILFLVAVLVCLMAFRGEIAWWYVKWDLQRQNPDWKEYGGHLYRTTPTRSTWIDAENYAKGLGGHLATLSAKEEQDWLVDMFGSESYWIGLTDQDSEGDWRWVTGEPIRFTNWFPGEPNNATATGEHFGLINANNVPGGMWNDIGPTVKQQGIVELSGP